MALREQVVHHRLRSFLLRSNSVQFLHWPLLLEERKGAKTCTQRSKDSKVGRRSRMERQDALHASFGMATGSKQPHAQEIH